MSGALIIKIVIVLIASLVFKNKLLFRFRELIKVVSRGYIYTHHLSFSCINSSELIILQRHNKHTNTKILTRQLSFIKTDALTKEMYLLVRLWILFFKRLCISCGIKDIILKNGLTFRTDI